MYFKELFILYTKTMSNFSVLVILSGQKDSNFHCYCIRVVSYNRLDDVPIYVKQLLWSHPDSNREPRIKSPLVYH